MTPLVSHDNRYYDKITLHSKQGWKPCFATTAPGPTWVHAALKSSTKAPSPCHPECSRSSTKAPSPCHPECSRLACGQCQVRVRLSISISINGKCVVLCRVSTMRWTSNVYPTSGLPTALIKAKEKSERREKRLPWHPQGKFEILKSVSTP